MRVVVDNLGAIFQPQIGDLTIGDFRGAEVGFASRVELEEVFLIEGGMLVQFIERLSGGVILVFITNLRTNMGSEE